MLKDKKILFAITGSISAYKSVDIIRRLKEHGASVDVIMTSSATKFITPLTIQSACSVKVYTDIYDPPLSHISLPEEADLLLVAPATANIIGKFASGIADDLLSCVFVAHNKKTIIAPAMNCKMYENIRVQRNIQDLKESGVIFVGPDRGSLACGGEGLGRLSDTKTILEAVKSAFTKQDLKGHSLLITAGPTREYIDPVRFISNRSSGKMGYALAKAAFRRGADVTLISGPVCLEKPDGINTTYVETTAQMCEQVLQKSQDATIIIMSSAVSDYTPVEKDSKKIEKKDSITITLSKTIDILKELVKQGNKSFKVGFAAQTGFEIKKARQKLIDKGLDLIILNDVTEKGCGFDVDTNRVRVLSEDERFDKEDPLMTKEELAENLYDYIIEYMTLYNEKGAKGQ
ncbi:MAG: bifunctional phosphopantothenoylcysteine decarboxylase/phosphopantothenate--cysteine ligase CoaBC [Thermodesulfovibrionales bacterium]|nr:bifunctional phosphopantothenoylcysteine decarboxylase/phosphopantothenate--cysteine ligase CoaBC [Thermodesulfovibrionales bacterium]